ncbi:MAG TPA: S8 family serine peptidase, partial [Vicinamibacterales bacterium]
MSASASCRTGFLTVAAVAMLFATAVAADANGRRARLSADLAAHLTSSSTADVDVIVSGSTESVDRLVQRHGLRIKKWLSSGAVVSASKDSLESLAADETVEAVSGNALVRSQMAITTAVTGAQQAWAGTIAALGPVDGSGVGVAIIDSGIANHPALANRVIVNVDFTDPRGRGDDLYGHGTHIAGIVAARDYREPVAGSDSGMAP